MNRYKLASIFGVVVVAAFIAVVSVTGQEQRSASQPKAAASEFQGVDACYRCHYQPLPADAASGVTKFITLTESKTWQEKDKHAKAFELIDPEKSPLARQMVEQLGIVNIRQAKECLSCHSNWQREHDKPPRDFERGVTCESCHGASSLWEQKHDEPEWRKLAPAEKEKLGMVDVRSPIARARQCLACHVGDAAQGKFITHEMYAAGHPPLPGVELETFAAAMPPHWRHTSAKPDFAFREDFLKANPSTSAGGKMHRSHAALTSAVVAMQAALGLVENHARQSNAKLEFALYDCYACHHD
jgi:hypothetical protein